MARHLLFIDPVAKLNIKKDSSLLLAHTLEQQGQEAMVFFEEDLEINTLGPLQISAQKFRSRLKLDSFYLESFELGKKSKVELSAGDTIHMRLDPPFDTRYLRCLWMLRHFESKGINVLNSASGILLSNEKMKALEYESFFVPTYLGRSEEGFAAFLAGLNQVDGIILKPLDLYQGMGVEKLSPKDNLLAIFRQKAQAGVVMAQPYIKQVEAGETRAIYFRGRNLGNILKVPPKGAYLANVAQGASFGPTDLSLIQKARCEAICADLARVGVDWIAFDLLGDYVSEANVTCPGLLVEASLAWQKNLALDIISAL